MWGLIEVANGKTCSTEKKKKKTIAEHFHILLSRPSLKKKSLKIHDNSLQPQHDIDLGDITIAEAEKPSVKLRMGKQLERITELQRCLKQVMKQHSRPALCF